jgi:hypothetical protein
VGVLYPCSSKINNVEQHFSSKSKENRISQFISKAYMDFTIHGNTDSKVGDHSIQGQILYWKEKDIQGLIRVNYIMSGDRDWLYQLGPTEKAFLAEYGSKKVKKVKLFL